MSVSRSGPVGFQPSSDRVRALDAGMSRAAKSANQPKCSRPRRFHRHAQSTADHLGDLCERHALVGNTMIGRLGRTVVEHEAIQARGIQPVHAGPAVQALADIGRHACLARQADQERDEGAVADAVHRRRETDGGGAHAALCKRPRGRLRFAREGGRGRSHVRLGRDPAGSEQRDPSRDNERPLRTIQRGPQDFDCPRVLRGIFGEPGKVVIEGGMDHRVGARGTTAQDIGVVERAAEHAGAGGGECGRLGLGAGEAYDLVTGADQFLDHCGADPAGAARDENAHAINPRASCGAIVDTRRLPVKE